MTIDNKRISIGVILSILIMLVVLIGMFLLVITEPEPSEGVYLRGETTEKCNRSIR